MFGMPKFRFGVGLGWRKKKTRLINRSSGKGQFCKDTRWWNEDVHNIVKTKRTSSKTWQKSRNEEDFERYKYVRKYAKIEIRDAKFKLYDDLYDKLGTKDGEKDVYKLAKLRESKTRDFNHIKCIKNEDSREVEKLF